jgi:predicted RNase H-like nuclease (RuvC/YqgF family)
VEQEKVEKGATMPEYVEKFSNGHIRLVRSRSHNHNHHKHRHRCAEDCCRRSQAEWDLIIGQNRDYAHQNGVLTLEVQSLKTNLSACHQREQTYRAENRNLENQNRRYVSDIAALKRSASLGNADQFRHRIRDLQGEVAAKDRENAALGREVNRLARHNRELEKVCEESLNRATGWRDTVDRRDREISRLQHDIARLQRAYEVQSETIRRLQEAVDNPRRRFW